MRKVRVLDYEVKVDGKLRPEPVRVTVGDLKKEGYPQDPHAVLRALAKKLLIADIDRIEYRLQ